VGSFWAPLQASIVVVPVTAIPKRLAGDAGVTPLHALDDHIIHTAARPAASQNSRLPVGSVDIGTPPLLPADTLPLA
jgi:hypothetical protein